MPSRGYRKGISDSKIPLGKRVHTRLPDTIHASLMADATTRSTDAAKILRALTIAHYTHQRLELPQARGPTSAVLRELCRIGNNLNQIAREAHVMKLHLLESDTRRTLAELLQIVRTLAA